MSRKTDEELLKEMKEKKKLEEEDEEEEDEEDESKESEVPQPQFVEREINLSLLNDKLNFIISVLQRK